MLALLVIAASNLLCRPARADEALKESERTPAFEGALGLMVHYNPAYSGASDYQTKVTPAGFVRWGRFTLTGSGGFTTLRQDDVDRGLGAELVRRPSFQAKLGLRYDNGRSASDSPGLAGLGDIPRTVRARLSARWDIAEHWRLTGGISVDAAGRGGGYFGDLSLARIWKLSKHGSLTVSAGLVAAGDRYLQAWHGVTPEQSARSGLPIFTVAEGLRDMSLSAVWREELSPDWAVYAGGGVVRMLGAAAKSPLTGRVNAVSLSAGLVRRF